MSSMNGQCRRGSARSRAMLRAFGRDEDGSMVIFALFLLLVMIMVGGMAVDLMRFESQRSRLQTTLDRAVLAAADLDQMLDPEQVVYDYFDKAGLVANVTDVTVTEDFTSRTVSAEANLGIEMTFMRFLGIDRWVVPATGSAREAVTDLEISLVLDISGSMRWNNRLAALQPAAVEFVSTVLDSTTGNNASINLIPYAGSTNPGPLMFDYINAVRYPEAVLDDRGTSDPNDDIMFPNVSSCVEIARSEFNHTGLPSIGGDQVPHFMNWDIAASVMDWGWCPEDDTSITYTTNDETLLHTAINSIRMHDGTGTHYAMRWALALLDPTARPAFQHLHANGAVPSFFQDRPLDWDAPEAAKFIVLMTDGQITEQRRPVDTLHPLNPSLELQRRHGSHSYRLTPANYNVSDFYKSCNAAKAQGVIVYTIAFEAPSSAHTEMSNCASSPSHFYIANGAFEIRQAFQSIANQINDLRLMQ